MSFFYDLNKKLDGIRATPEVTHKQLNERDMGKHNNATTGFAALAKKAGGGEKGEKIAGAQFQKMKKAGQLEEEGMSRAAKGYEKYGREGMEALAKAGRDGKALDPVRKKYDKYDNEQVDEKVETYRSNNSGNLVNTVKQGQGPFPTSQDTRDSYAKDVRALRAAGGLKKDSSGQRSGVAPSGRKIEIDNFEEGMMDTVKKVGKKVAGGINRLVGHGSDEDMRKDVQRKAGVPQTGKKPEQKTTEAAKYRDPKYKDRLYTQEPPDYTYGPDYDDAYDNPKPDDYAGRKRKIGGGEFDHNDPLVKGFGRSGTGSPVEKGPRKGLPTRNQISSLKGSIKAARGTHAEPNLPEAAGAIDFDKVLDAIAALYGDDMWNNDAMQDLANELEQAGPTDRELDFIIAKGRLPKRLAGIQFSAGDDVQFGESGAPMSSKQKSFAALAPPANKITFADKIAGAKKEVDEMLGDVAAEAMRGALSGGQKKLDKNHNGKLDANDFAMLRKGAKKGHSGEMDEENDFTAHQRPAVAQPKVGSTERGHKHDIKHTATGRMVTRRTDPQGNSVGADDASDAQAGPRGRGRPKGTKGAIGAKGPSGKSKLMTREGDNESSELKAAMMLLKKSGYKVTKAESTDTRDDHAERAGKKVTKDIEYDEKKKDSITGKKRGPEDDKAEKSGKKVTKDIEHDEKKEKEVDESTTSGSVATSTATKGGGGSMVGKGVYDSINRELEKMIAESMSINMSDSTEGGKSLTITATDEDALKLGMMLKNAGLGGGDAHGSDMHSHGDEPCDTCGMADCGCGDVEQAVDENAPDWPTNTETSDNAMQYSGGLNKPKASGMATVPVTDVSIDGEDMFGKQANEDALRRMMEMAGIKQAELDPSKETMKEQAQEELDESKECSTCHKAPCECDEDVEESFLESITRMREIAGIKEAKKQVDQNGDGKNDFEDIKIARMKASGAIDDKEEKKVDESIFALTNQWKAYRG